MYCTYITTHKPTSNFYIGKTSVKKHLAGYKGSGIKIARALKKYPDGEWMCQILMTFETEQEAYDDEQSRVTYDTLANPLCLNLYIGGRGGASGYKASPETRAKISQAGIGRVLSPETRAKISALHKGNTYCLGKVSSDATKKKLSERIRSAEEVSRRAKSNTQTWANKSNEEKLEHGAKMKAQWAERTPEQLKARSDKMKATLAKRTPAELQARKDKIAATWAKRKETV